MTDDLVTVIAAIYNGERFLGECIESVISQSYKNLEIILVDDGSSDSSLKICKEYEKKDSRIHVLHQENSGVSVARNNALTITHGKYVCFVDQDDLLDKDYIKYLWQLIKKTGAEVSVVPNVVYYTKDKQVYSEKHSPNLVECWSGEDTACEMLYNKMEIGPWSKMISMDLIKNNKMEFRLGLFGGEGYVFSVESFAAADKVAVGDKGIYYYRVDNYDSEMSKYRSRTLKSSLRAVRIMMDEYKNSTRRLCKATKYAFWRVYVAFLNSLVGSKTIKEHQDDYAILVKNARKYAYRSFTAEVPLKRKIKDLLYLISPRLVAEINVRKNKERVFNREGTGK